MDRVGQMTKPQLAIVTDDVTAIERIRRSESGRLETISAGHRTGPAKDARQSLI
jgi:hypothetical protein